MASDPIPEAFPITKQADVTFNARPGSTLKSRKWYQLGGRDYSHVAVDSGYDNRSETSSFNDSDSEVVKNHNNVFEAKEAVDIYKPIEGYEGAHRFVPDATWTQAEESALVRKVCAIEVLSK